MKSVWLRLIDAKEAYREKFGEDPSPGNMVDPEVRVKDINQALKTGKKVSYPDAPPGILI